MKKPSLSIIVPVYKVEDTLCKCVESVLSQSYADWEMILVDDGSPDSCPQLCDTLAERDVRIRVIHKKNGGLSDARNAGLEAAQAGYITFLDSDDEYADNTLAPLMSMLERHPEYDILEYGLLWNRGHLSQQQYTFQEKTYDTFFDYWDEGEGYIHCWACNKIFKASLFREERFCKGIVFEDVELMGRLLQHQPVVHTTSLGNYLYNYNEGGISKRYDATLKVLLQNQLEIINRSEIDMNESRWHPMYMAMLNTQIDVFTITGEVLLPYAKVGIRRYGTRSSILKALLLRTVGLKATLRLLALLKHRGITAHTA